MDSCGQMKVLHTSLSFNAGGRREAIATLCAGLARHGVENYLCCLDSHGSDETLRESLFADCIELGRKRLCDLDALYRLRRFCRLNDIDILHAHDAASQATCALAMPACRVPLLMSFHRTRNFESARARDRLRNALAGLRTAAIVTTSQERHSHYRSHNHVAADKVLLIPLGTDLERFHPNPARKAALRSRLQLPEHGLLVGVIGHFGEEKGVDIAIDAFQILCRRCPRIHPELVVLGEGSRERTDYITAAIDPALAERIHLVGFQAQSQHWTCGFDVLLHAARAEAFGLVLIEAMACGVPVVAPAVGGIPDIVRDRVCGRLVAAPDAKLLAAALADLLVDADERRRLAQGALERASSEYSQHAYVRKFLDLYRSLLARRRSG